MSEGDKLPVYVFHRDFLRGWRNVCQKIEGKENYITYFTKWTDDKAYYDRMNKDYQA